MKHSKINSIGYLMVCAQFHMELKHQFILLACKISIYVLYSVKQIGFILEALDDGHTCDYNELCAWLWIEWLGFYLWPGSLHCVLRHDNFANAISLIVSLRTQVYKWMPLNLLLGDIYCCRIASHPGGGRGKKFLQPIGTAISYGLRTSCPECRPALLYVLGGMTLSVCPC